MNRILLSFRAKPIIFASFLVPETTMCRDSAVKWCNSFPRLLQGVPRRDMLLE